MRLSSKLQAFLEMNNEVTCRMSTLLNLFDYGLMIIWDTAMYKFEDKSYREVWSAVLKRRPDRVRLRPNHH